MPGILRRAAGFQVSACQGDCNLKKLDFSARFLSITQCIILQFNNYGIFCINRKR